MGGKLLWTGLTVIIALGTVLRQLNIGANDTTIAVVGAIIMVVGCVLMWLNK